MPTARTPRPFLARGLAAILCLGWLPPAARAADEPAVVAAIAVDPYAELKQQARWVGAQIDQPTLDGFLESFIMIGTQFKGLAGLDVNRPAGVVVTAEGPAGVPVPRGLVPVKDLGKLLEALQGIIGPAQEQDGVWTISPAGMPAIQIVERNGWAIFAPQGSPDAPTGLEKALDGVVESFSLGVQVFPARMPDGMRKQLEAALQQAAAMQAQQGQPVDADALQAGLRNLAEVETILLGASVDIDQQRVFLENRFAMVPGSAAGGLSGEMAKAVLSTPAAATADGKPAAVSGHVAMAVPESLRGVVKDALARALPEPAPMVFELLRAVVPAMLDAGGLDAALTIDTAAAEMADGKALPAVTVGMKVKDGRALEADLKAAVGAAGALPQGVTANFDAGKAGAANLHVVEVAMAEQHAVRAVGAKLPIVLGVTPTHAFVAAGGDAEKRIATAAGGGKTDPDAKPLAGLDVSLGECLSYAAGMQQLTEPHDPEGIEMWAAAAAGVDDLPSSLMQLSVRPIDQGMATRLSADAGAIRLLKRFVALQQPAPQPAGFGPGPVPKAQPTPLPGLAP